MTVSLRHFPITTQRARNSAAIDATREGQFFLQSAYVLPLGRRRKEGRGGGARGSLRMLHHTQRHQPFGSNGSRTAGKGRASHLQDLAGVVVVQLHRQPTVHLQPHQKSD